MDLSDGVDGGESCVPDCTGKECGDDGCGGSCGTCPVPTGPMAVTCREGSCVELGLMGAPCSEDDDCWYDLCLDTWKGKVCTNPCFECIEGWSCRPYHLDPIDVIFVCLPDFVFECVPTVDSVSLSGHIVLVSPQWVPVSGGTVTLLEDPDVQVAVEDGGFTLSSIPPCSQATLVLDHPDLHAVQSATLFVHNEDIDNLTLQTPDHATWDLFLGMTGKELNPSACQVATTISKAEHWGKGPGHAFGEDGAAATTTPGLPPKHGPIYFQIGPDGIIYPDPSLKLTSEDGGVLFVDLPPGDYLLDAKKEGVTFQPAWIRCHPGAFVNASPPFGIQGIE